MNKMNTPPYPMRHLLSAFLLLMLPTFGWCQSVILPSEVKAEPREQIIVAPDKVAPGAVVNWRIGAGLIDDTARIEKLFGPLKSPGKILRAFKAGKYKIEAWVIADATKPLDRSSVLAIMTDKSLTAEQKVESASSMLQGISVCWIIVGDVTPDPKPPDPKPPDPPIPGEGFRVLIVYESGQKLPPAQVPILASKEVRDYLNAKCVKEKGKPEWRIYDKDTPMDNESELWRGAMKQTRGPLPWIMIGNTGDASRSYSGPLPGTVAETLALLKKYGG